MKRETFTHDEVEALVKYAYEVGFCDGVDGDGTYSPDAKAFWLKNAKEWVHGEIKYVKY